MVQRGRLVGVFPQGPPRVDLRLRHPWLYLQSPTSREIGCSWPSQVLRPSPHELWRAQRGVVGSTIVRSSVVAVPFKDPGLIQLSSGEGITTFPSSEDSAVTSSLAQKVVDLYRYCNNDRLSSE